MKHGEGNAHVRKLFYLQKYDSFEEEKIREFEQIIDQEKIVLPDELSYTFYVVGAESSLWNIYTLVVSI